MTFDGEHVSVADYGLIGDCRSAALVSRTGSIDWMCAPRFDSGSAFARLLDAGGGGHCSISPCDQQRFDASHAYLEDTLVLATTFRAESGTARVLDLLVIPEEEESESRIARRLLRIVEGERGTVELELRIAPRFDYGGVRPWVRRHGDHLQSAIGGNDALIMWSEAGLDQEDEHTVVSRITVRAGERSRVSITYCRPENVPDQPEVPEPHAVDADLERTISWWRDWCGRIRTSADTLDVRRSALVLKALTYDPTGAIVAAPTTSLPEAIPGERNWDYRYAWVRDASFSSRAFAEIGCEGEAAAFREFIMRSAAGHADDLQIVYGLGGERRLGQSTIHSLGGYRGVGPVRKGNDAVGQRQLDAYGEIVNLSWRWHRRGHSPSDDEWRFIVSLIDRAAELCGEPDRGIWEWAGDPEHFVHSKVMCWAALDRGIRLADECMRRAPTRRWARIRDELKETIEARGYDSDRGIFVQTYDRPELDAALLLLPTTEFVAWDDERMLRTVSAVREELDAGDGLLYRYRRPDGLEGDEGAFLCCSFWLVECLARAGNLAEAQAVFDQAVASANDLGLFPEEADPATGEPRGNFPQGLTHLSHVSAAVALAGQHAALGG